MDNNPFRSQQSPAGNYMPPSMGGQLQQQPYQPNYNSNTGSGYSSVSNTPQTGYYHQQQQQQPSWQYQQQQQNSMMSPPFTQQHSNFTSSLPLQQPSFTSTLPSTNTNTANIPPPSQYSPYSTNASLMSSTATSNVNTPPQMSNFGAGGNTYQPYYGTPSTTNMYPTNGNNMMYGNNGYQPYQQQNDPSNFYIPPNFGMSSTSNNNMFQQQSNTTPKHAPVDASTLLKGTQVRRVECPVCQKMIEGDDMAVNHHVNEHYT